MSTLETKPTVELSKDDDASPPATRKKSSPKQPDAERGAAIKKEVENQASTGTAAATNGATKPASKPSANKHTWAIDTTEPKNKAATPESDEWPTLSMDGKPIKKSAKRATHTSTTSAKASSEDPPLPSADAPARSSRKTPLATAKPKNLKSGGRGKKKYVPFPTTAFQMASAREPYTNGRKPRNPNTSHTRNAPRTGGKPHSGPRRPNGPRNRTYAPRNQHRSYTPAMPGPATTGAASGYSRQGGYRPRGQVPMTFTPGGTSAYFSPQAVAAPGFSPIFAPMPIPTESMIADTAVRQVEYYFSVDNLCKDMYLRKHMDKEGYVPLSLIANFPRVKKIIGEIDKLTKALASATVVEVDSGRIRRKEDWAKWLLPNTT